MWNFLLALLLFPTGKYQKHTQPRQKPLESIKRSETHIPELDETSSLPETEQYNSIRKD